MARISPVSSVMEAYYKLTQSQLSEEDIKQELSEEAKNQKSDTSQLDDLTEVIGAIREEIQFLNKAKDTFNEIYKIVNEAYEYLKSFDHNSITDNEKSELKVNLDNYIYRINFAVSNENNKNFSKKLVDYFNKLTGIDLNNIHELLSDYEVQTKSRLLGGIDSSISTNEIVSSKNITVKGPRGPKLRLNFLQFTNEETKTMASQVNANSEKTGVIADARNKLSISDLSANGVFSFKLTNTKTGSSGHTISGINITDNSDLTPLFSSVNNANASTGVRAEISEDKSLVSLIDDKGYNINLSSINEASGTKTFNAYSEYRRSTRDVDLKKISMNFGTDTERAGGYIEFFGHNKLRAEDINLIKVDTASKTLGAISIVGEQISIGTGDDSAPIGYIHSTIDGEDGARLRIKFYETLFPNGGFEASNLGDTTLNGWSITNNKVRLGVDQIGGLNSPSDPTYPTPNSSASLFDLSNLKTSLDFIAANTFSTTVVDSTTDTNVDSSGADTHDSKVVRMNSNIESVDGYAVIRGPYLVSNNPLYLRSGEVVSFDYKVKAGDDAYDAFGYLVNSDTNEFVTILNETGTSASAETTWATKSVDVTKSGNYKFVFASGSYDFSGGTLLGANLYLDNIAITPGPKLAVNNKVLQQIADHITLKNVNMDLEDQDLNPRVEAAIAPIGSSITTKSILDPVTTSLANATGGINTTHTISVAGIYDTVGESIDTRTVTIAANASAKLISEQLNAQIIHTNVGFSAKTGVVISDADNDNTIRFKLSNNNGGTVTISANITTNDLNNLKDAINAQTGTTGVDASNGVVARDSANNPIWTLGNEKLLLTQSSGEDIAITELSGVAVNVRPTNFEATTYEESASTVSLQAARNLIINPKTSDQRVKITTDPNSIQATYRITGTNLSGSSITENVTVVHNDTEHSTNSFGTVTQIQLINGTSGSTKVGTSSDDDAVANASPVNQSNLTISGGTAYLDLGEFIRIQAEANTKATNFTIYGNDANGSATTETITSSPGSAVSTTNRFTTITRIAAAGDLAGGELIQIRAGNGTNNGTQFTISGTNASGASINETLNSIANTSVSTSQRFTTVTQIAADSDLNGTVIAGIATNTSQLATSQTVSGAGNLTLTSSTSTPGNRSVIAGTTSNNSQFAANQTVNSSSDLSLTSGTPIVLTDGKAVTLFTPTNGVVGQYTVTGKNKLGSTITENLTGIVNDTVTGSNLFMTVTNVAVNSLSPGNVKIGSDIDDDGISTQNAYTGNGATNINGSFEDGGIAVLNNSTYDLTIVGEGEGSNINETVTVVNNSTVTTANRYSTINSITISGSGQNTGRIEVYASDILTKIANEQIKNAGESLTLTGSNFQNDSTVAVGALQANSNQRFTISSSNNYYSLQNRSDELDPVVFTTPIPRDTTAGLKVSTNENHEIISTGELFMSSHKSFTVTQQDASEELKNIQITSDGSAASVNFTIEGTDQFGNSISEVITSSTGTIVAGNEKFAAVTSVKVNNDTVGNVEVGTSLDPDIISQSQRSKASGDLIINGARTNPGTAGVATLKMASTFEDEKTATFTLEGGTFTYTADGNETAAQARDRLLTNPGAGEFQGADSETITTASAGVLQVTDKKGVNLFTIQSDGTADGLRFTENNPDGIFKITNASGNVPPNSITTTTQSIARRATLIDDGSTFFSNYTNNSEVQLSNFNIVHNFFDQEFTTRYGHALTDVQGTIISIENQLLKEENVNSAGEKSSVSNSLGGYTKEQFTEMGLKTAERIRKMDTKTLLIKNIHAQKNNLNMLMSGQLYGFALLNFKGNFNLTKK